jgi:GrpB-like predicted nucleotidyltransferase (UPF0157 family)
VAPRDPNDVESYDEKLAEIMVAGVDRQTLRGKVEIADYDPEWPALYVREEERIRSILGDRVVRIEHTGSTSVPSLPAKPIIDIVLEVPDAAAEDDYLLPLESAGYVLAIRESDWLEHRLFKGPDTNINLHVFSAGCSETDAMVLLRDWLRANASDRELYATTKRELAARDWKYVQQYADAKSDVVQAILARARLAHEH